ncbi:MAG: FAD-binding oxidoreductase [Actinomycetota bacterium]
MTTSNGRRGDADVVVIGGGIAGVAAAYALCTHPRRPRVHLVETEAQLAHHTTGRSAAQLIVNYGTAPTKALTVASLPFFRHTPDGLVDAPLLTERGVLSLATDDQDDVVAANVAEGRAAGARIELLDPDQALDLVPLLRPDAFTQAVYEPESADIDVAGLHQAFVRGVRAAGGVIETSRAVTDLTPTADGWRCDTTDGPLEAAVVVNAAGAWGDVVAGWAGVRPVGLQPRRRTAFMVNATGGGRLDEPLACEITHRWYIKRDGAQYLCSPADQTPSEPCDAKPEELDVAMAIDRINAATTLDIRSVRSAWAGLRTFAPDETMVLGPDPDRPAFVWCVGQGGTGIQTAPSAGRLVADLSLDGRPGLTFGGVSLDLAEAFGAGRLRS